MIFNKHYELEGLHAFLGASKYHWINYDDKKLIETFNSYLAIQRGTKLHELAKQLIEMNVNLPKRKKTFMRMQIMIFGNLFYGTIYDMT